MANIIKFLQIHYNARSFRKPVHQIVSYLFLPFLVSLGSDFYYSLLAEVYAFYWTLVAN